MQIAPSHLLLLKSEPARPRGSALFASGFRPFFLLAAGYALVGVPLWVAILAGALSGRVPENPLDWHAHEMVFGYTGAVLAGFLLTAIRKWTQQPTLDGWRLGALCLVWSSARVAPFVTSVPAATGALLDLAFWILLLAACARPILRAGNRRNYGFIGLLTAFALAASCSHANRLGYVHGEFWSVRSLGVDLVAIAIVVMTGRIVPSFTRNATRAADISETPTYDRVAIIASVFVALLDALSAPSGLSAVPAAVAGAAVLGRARHWGPKHTSSDPLLWSLHLAHASLGAGLLLRGLTPWVGLPPSIALHAITAGGIGLATLSMMIRVTLGHTGRMLQVPASIGAALALLSAAALLRVLGPLLAPSHLTVALTLAGILWSAAFAGYLLRYGRALVAPRVDGVPG